MTPDGAGPRSQFGRQMTSRRLKVSGTCAQNEPKMQDELEGVDAAELQVWNGSLE